MGLFFCSFSFDRYDWERYSVPFFLPFFLFLFPFFWRAEIIHQKLPAASLLFLLPSIADRRKGLPISFFPLAFFFFPHTQRVDVLALAVPSPFCFLYAGRKQRSLSFFLPVFCISLLRRASMTLLFPFPLYGGDSRRPPFPSVCFSPLV